VYETPDGPRTGAYLASRVARDVVEQRMVALLDPDWNLDGSAAADLQRSVRAALEWAPQVSLDEGFARLASWYATSG